MQGFIRLLPGNHGHCHNRVHEKDIFDGRGKLFSQQSHCPKHLTERVISFSKLRGRHLSPLQRHALDCYHKDDIYNLRGNINNFKNTDILGAFFNLFDKLFFFGTIKERCRVQFSSVESRVSRLQGYSKFSAVGIVAFGERPKLRAKIKLYSGNETEPRRRLRLIGYIGTLLHEMIHTFLELWSCPNRDCNRRHEANGVTGHGYLFLDISYALQRAAMDRGLLGLDLDVTNECSLAEELKEAGRREIPRHRLAGWGFRYEYVVRAMGMLGAPVCTFRPR
jgi:hypothetical protein